MDGAVSLKEIINHLKKVYCQSIGVEYMRCDPKKNWIKNYIHQNDNQPNFTPDQKKQN